MRRFLLAMYPRQWRARYGDEFAALLQDCRRFLKTDPLGSSES